MKKHLTILFMLAGLVAAAQSKQLSVKEFLKLSTSDTTSYVVGGIVTKIRSTSSGSFYLRDNTGTMLIYGIQDSKRKGLSFKQLDIIQGDSVWVLGRFTIYGGSTKEMKDGRLVRKVDGPQHNMSFYDRLSQKPAFKGKEGHEALEAFIKWVQEQVAASHLSEKGTVKISFVVGRNGKVQEVQLLKGATKDLNQEAIRIINKSPQWRPAKSDGQPIRFPYTIEVTF